MTRPGPATAASRSVAGTLPYIVSRLGSVGARLTLTELARAAHVDPYYLHRIFREVTGHPVHRYVRQRRLEYAAYRLLFTDLRVIDIAFAAGYDSHAAFSRAFRRTYGAPPVSFRDVGRADTPVREREPVVTTRTDSRLLAYVPHFGPYRQVGQAWRRLRGWLEAHGVAPGSAPSVGICYDHPDYWLAGDLRYDACAVIPGELAAHRGVGIQRLPAMTALTLGHHGAPELLVCTYLRLAVAAARAGLVGQPEPAPLPYYEVYPGLPYGDDGDDGEVAATVQIRVGPAAPAAATGPAAPVAAAAAAGPATQPPWRQRSRDGQE